MAGSDSVDDGADTERTVTVLTREDCHLCEDAIERVDAVADDVDRPVTVRVVDVDGAGLADEYGDKVPYVFVDGRPAFKFRVDATTLRTKLTG